MYFDILDLIYIVYLVSFVNIIYLFKSYFLLDGM